MTEEVDVIDLDDRFLFCRADASTLEKEQNGIPVKEYWANESVTEWVNR